MFQGFIGSTLLPVDGLLEMKMTGGMSAHLDRVLANYVLPIKLPSDAELYTVPII